MTAASNGPVLETAEIFAVQNLGEYTLFTVVAPKIAERARPGQFLTVSVGGPDTSMPLRRAFAIYDAKPGAEFAGTVQFVVAPHGRGTHWILEQQPGARFDLVGPLGIGFELPPTPRPAVLVGGGYGSAPLIMLAHQLLAADCPVEIIIGAATAGRLFGELVARRTVGSVTVLTDDGSAGSRGLVTEPLAETISRTGAEVVYACGPMGMLRAVGEIARVAQIPAQVAVEESMACGIGVCMTCVLPVRGSDGKSRFLRSCVDGPVFLAERVRWSEVGTLPPDLVGADAMAAH
jgi:dihydroorotate dehydrogenase electron transfer subunit